MEMLMQDEKYMSAYIQLSDKFGDNGIIAVTFGTWNKDALVIDGWLMSCRVLKRDVEKMTCNYIVEHARRNGKRFIYGSYIPTDRNGMVSSHFADMGFEMVESLDGGQTRWTLDVRAYVPAAHSIEIEEH